MIILIRDYVKIYLDIAFCNAIKHDTLKLVDDHLDHVPSCVLFTKLDFLLQRYALVKLFFNHLDPRTMSVGNFDLVLLEMIIHLNIIAGIFISNFMEGLKNT